jgi:hypothetical protein
MLPSLQRGGISHDCLSHTPGLERVPLPLSRCPVERVPLPLSRCPVEPQQHIYCSCVFARDGKSAHLIGLSSVSNTHTRARARAHTHTHMASSSHPHVCNAPHLRVQGPDTIAVGNSITAEQFNKWVVTGPLEQVRSKHAHRPPHTHTHTHTHTHIHTHTYIHNTTHTHTHTHTHTYTTHTQTHTHTHKLDRSSLAHSYTRPRRSRQGVTTNFEVQEVLLDHAFELLGIDDDRVNHPVGTLTFYTLTPTRLH